MSTQAPSATDRLSPSWIRRSLSPRKRSVEPEPRPSSGSLKPPSTSGSSNSDDSRSSPPRRRSSIRGIYNRLRSPSMASLQSIQSIECEFDQIDDWFYGFRKYNQLVSTHFSPKKSYPSPEFSKASKALTKNCGGQFHHGLPEAVFDFSLLWCPSEKLTRKEDSNEPSWSWTGYHGQVNFPFDPTTSPDIYTAPRSEAEWFRSEIVNFHIGPESAQYTVRREKANSLRVKYPPYFHAPRGSDHTTASNTLRFTASTIPADGFCAEQLRYQNNEIPCSQLLNDKKQQCGVIMDYESGFNAPCSTGPFEFVLLSRNLRREHSTQSRKPTQPTMHPGGTPIWDGDHFVWDEEIADFDEEVFSAGPWKMLNVMLIRWAGERAERVAVGRIHEDAWLAQKPLRAEIVLT